MKKDSYEKLDDGFVNLYEEGIFIRCFEYSAILISNLTGYRLFGNIDKKTGKIFIECAFPKNKLNQIIMQLETKGYCLRIKEFDGELSLGNLKLERYKQELITLKQKLIKLV